MKTTLGDMLASRDWLLADGAMGTNLFAVGLETGHPPELWNFEHPERIETLHRQFIDAGSDIILTNSFGGTSFRLKLHDMQDQVLALNRAAAMRARAVADAHAHPVLVAGSIGPTGELFAPLGALTAEAARDAFTAQLDGLVQGGIDVIWIETMSAIEEVEAAFLAAQETGLPVIATMTFDSAGRSMMGVQPAAYADFVDGLGIDGFGANCGIGPAELLDSVRKFAPLDRRSLVVAKGNCGIPVYDEGEIHYHGTPALMSDYAVLARDLGVRIIGGCCGTSVAHIAAMHKALTTTPQQPPPQ